MGVPATFAGMEAVDVPVFLADRIGEVLTGIRAAAGVMRDLDA
jgi:hypothetical protein